MNGLGIVLPIRADRPQLPNVFMFREYEGEQAKYIEFDEQEAVAHVLAIRLGDRERLKPYDLDAATLLAQRQELITHRTLEAARTEAMLTAIKKVEELVSSCDRLCVPRKMSTLDRELNAEGVSTIPLIPPA